MDADSSDDSEQEELAVKILPKRCTRGVRISDLHGEGDDDFYGQDFWQEGQHDSDFSEAESEEDVVDSDFDDTEEESDEEEVVVAKEKGKRKGTYVDKALQNKKARGAKAKPASTPKGGRRSQEVVSSPAKKRSLRASTKDKSAAQKAKLKQKVTKKRVEKVIKQWSQEELLKEAEQTEIINKQSLADMLRIEELNKKRNVSTIKRLQGPGILYHSKAGRQTLTFTRVEAIPDDVFCFSANKPTPVKNLKCKITDQPAKYRDPQTGEAYASLSAFKTLRSSVSAK